MPRSIQFTFDCFEEYKKWRKRDKEVTDKIDTLLIEIARDPFKGLGKPEPLKGQFQGYWSRRITQEHRLVYRVVGDVIVVYRCFGHYDD